MKIWKVSWKVLLSAFYSFEKSNKNEVQEISANLRTCGWKMPLLYLRKEFDPTVDVLKIPFGFSSNFHSWKDNNTLPEGLNV